MSRKTISPPKEPKSKVPGTAKSCLKTGNSKLVMPDYLGPMGRRCWSSVVATLGQMGVLDGADARAIEAFASAYEEYRKARKTCLDDGYSYETYDGKGELRYLKRPEVEVMNGAWTRMRSLLPELYMTTLSRLKKSPGKSDDNTAGNPFDEFFNN